MKPLALIALVLGLLGAAPLLAAEKASDPKTATEHMVRPGETLGGVANRAGVPRLLIAEANGLEPPYLLKAGQKLVIPRRRLHTVKPNESQLSIALDYSVPWSTIAAANGLEPDNPIKTGQKLVIPTLAAKKTSEKVAPPTPGAIHSSNAPKFAWPIRGKLRRPFQGPDAKDGAHEGIDLFAPLGTSVRASAAGKVIFAGQGPDVYGLTVVIFHGGRWTTTYSFLHKVLVKEGEEVKAGTRIGLVGETGLADEPQLHFEVRRNRVALDPAKYLSQR